ncbi:MAG: HNH endonuclease [Candidatus Acidiferrales bacterium]
MPAVAPEDLAEAIASAISDSGYVGRLTSALRSQPKIFVVTDPQAGMRMLAVYAWSLTFGGRPALANEYRIQMTGVRSPLQINIANHAVLVGYEPNLKLFAGFDLQRHRTFTGRSPSVQIDIEALRLAETEGLSFHRKSNDEIAIGIRPDMFVAYSMNAAVLHRFGRDANVLRLLSQAVHAQPAPRDIEALPVERQRVISEVSRLSRAAGFRRRVLFAYGNRCAVTRIQLRLVEAAHILPVGAPGSIDHVRNGIALSPTYHRAFDAGLIYLDDEHKMRINNGQAHLLERMDLAGGLPAFKSTLGQTIFLPPDANQRPDVDFIRRANRFRQVHA